MTCPGLVINNQNIKNDKEVFMYSINQENKAEQNVNFTKQTRFSAISQLTWVLTISATGAVAFTGMLEVPVDSTMQSSIFERVFIRSR